MNRLGTVAIFKAIERLAKIKDNEGIEEIAAAVLNEAMGETKKV